MTQLESVTGYLHSIDTFGGVDGPGIRFIAFFQGCPLRCLYCHNPDSWSFGQGEQTTAGELVQNILQYRNFLRRGGVTLSGGEPLAQPEFAYAVLELCRHHGLHTAIDTSGTIPLSVSQTCIDTADMLLLDLKELDAQDAITLTGQSNENTFKTLSYCNEIHKPVWLRHVCLPGYTLQEEKLRRLAEYLQSFSCIELIELIPFHQMGIYKWDYVDAEYQLRDTPQPTKDEMQAARAIFEEYGLPVH